MGGHLEEGLVRAEVSRHLVHERREVVPAGTMDEVNEGQRGLKMVKKGQRGSTRANEGRRGTKRANEGR